MEMCCKKNKKIKDSEKKYTLLFYFYGIFLEKKTGKMAQTFIMD